MQGGSMVDHETHNLVYAGSIPAPAIFGATMSNNPVFPRGYWNSFRLYRLLNPQIYRDYYRFLFPCDNFNLLSPQKDFEVVEPLESRFIYLDLEFGKVFFHTHRDDWLREFDKVDRNRHEWRWWQSFSPDDVWLAEGWEHHWTERDDERLKAYFQEFRAIRNSPPYTEF